MTSVRVYTLLTPDQKRALEKIASDDDRSVSWLIARAIDKHVKADLKPTGTTKSQATEKVFTRTTPEAAELVKGFAAEHECHDWKIVNAAVQLFLLER